eukprot:gnl/Hemi2/18896_TR6259_c0_g1_i1.p1 gnl/Hemi2/18896_TR6259_c0_g1~~gnl/Hemi2/18896_TR6259_c0_g1_i1.p1  ORF type:complete len:162 (+),score=9.83 gnl/Hemi2/18896_TR6259_c0_g1_i1:56-541(+)
MRLLVYGLLLLAVAFGARGTDLLTCGNFRTYNPDYELCCREGTILCKSADYSLANNCPNSDYQLLEPYVPDQMCCSRAPDGSFNFCTINHCCVNSDPIPSPPLCFSDSSYSEAVNKCSKVPLFPATAWSPMSPGTWPYFQANPTPPGALPPPRVNMKPQYS